MEATPTDLTRFLRAWVATHRCDNGSQWYVDEDSVDVDADELWRVVERGLVAWHRRVPGATEEVPGATEEVAPGTYLAPPVGIEVAPRRYGRGFGPARPCPVCGRAICRRPTTGRIMRHNQPLVSPNGLIWIKQWGHLLPAGMTTQPGYPSIPKPNTRCPASNTLDADHERNDPNAPPSDTRA